MVFLFLLFWLELLKTWDVSQITRIQIAITMDLKTVGGWVIEKVDATIIILGLCSEIGDKEK